MAHIRAVDRVLKIPHVLEEVFVYVALERRTVKRGYLPASDNYYYNTQTAKDGRRTLARSAQVCKAFEGPALDVLWRMLNDLLVLLRILPTFQKYTARSFNILGQITPAQWTRFQYYARRVRELGETALEDSVATVDNMVWTVLESLLHGQPMLPKLRVLSVMEFDQNYLAPSALLLSSLHTLEIWFSDGAFNEDRLLYETRPLARGVLLQHLIPRCRHLSHLSIRDGLEFTPAHVFSSLSLLDRVQTLDLVYSDAVGDYATLQTLSKLPLLRDLSVKFCIDDYEDTQELPPLRGSFLELHQLHLSGHILDLRRVFEVAECPRLTTLHLTISEETTVDDLRDGLAAICDQVPQSLHEARVVSFTTIYGPTTPASVLLEPLLAFCDLRDVRIELYQYLPRMSDLDARAFATAWPQLEHFHITYSEEETDLTIDQLTIHGLIEFARGCPELYHLDVPSLDVRLPPSLDMLPMVRLPSLQNLVLHQLIGGRTANLLDFAVALDRLFPSAGRLRSVTVEENILGEILRANEFCQPVRVLEMLLGAMWARRQGEWKATRRRL